MRNIITLLLGFVLVLLLSAWLEKRSDLVIIQSENYEKCVKAEYGMTPSYYYEVNGKYPECK